MMLMLPDIEISEQIYEGMVSRVYRGVRREDGVPIILKLLKGEYPSLEARQRYQQEYGILRKLDLEGVVKAYGLRELNHGLAMVLEDFGGRSLDQWLARRKFSLEEVLDYGMRIVQILDGLHAAHITHRDLNPSNLVLNPDTDTLKLIDFGLAEREVGGAIGSAKLRRIVGEDAGLGAGQFDEPSVGFSGVADPVLEGTLAYMAPEQTGRTQQRVDYRADYYALGVTLYEWLTQQLPFSAEDPLELIHCHLAKVPPTPRDRCPEIPQAVSEIVMRLLAKQPEDRYQSAYGLQADLQVCLQQWRQQGRVWTIPLGRQDRRTQLRIEGRLYGRESQRKQLQLMLEQVQRGERGWVMVSGYSGIGKSSLVQELQGPVAQMRGYFLRGKCEQLQRERPYQAIAQALDGLVQALLSEPACLLEEWRAQILPRLENQGQLLIDLVPGMGVLLGEQPPLASATSSLNLTLMAQVNTQRWYRVIQSCLSVTRRVLGERPVLLVLDDLQWIDVATLQLLQPLWKDPELKGIGFIGAYRNHEVDAAHPLSLAIAAHKKPSNPLAASLGGTAVSPSGSSAPPVKSSPGLIQEIQLSPLLSTDVNQLIADSLDTCPSQTLSLTDVVFAKTQGNPFFVKVFLTALHSDRLLYFDRTRGGWSWDLDRIRSQASTENVVDLLAHRIQRLPPAAQQVLRWAACIGHRFGRLAEPIAEGSLLVQSLGLDGMQVQSFGGNLGSEVSLDIAAGDIQSGESLSALEEPMDIQACLDLLVQRELIVSGTEDTERLTASGLVGLASEGVASEGFISNPGIKPPTLSQKPAQTYTFVHDRVQQAAYSLIPVPERSYYHWTLGQLLQRAAAIADRPDAHLFDWVNQLNLAAEASRAAFGAQPSTQPSPQPSAKIRPYPAQEGDRLQLIRLNLQAGKKAKLAAAYTLSARYCRAAVEQIISSDWEQDYDLAAEVYRNGIEAALVNSEFALMESWTATALTHSRDDVDTAVLVRLQIMACMVQNQPQQAIALTIPALRTFGITLPRHPKIWHVILGALRLRWQLRNKTDAQILALPPLQDRAQQAAIGIINYVGTASYLTASNFQALITFAVIRQSLISGNSAGSAQAYVVYGIAQASIVGNIPLGNRFAQLALQLTDHLGTEASEVRSRVLFLSYYLIRHWQIPLRDVIAPLQQAYAVGLEAGDIEYAAYSFYASVQQRFVAGDCLSDLIEPFALVYQRVAQLQQKTALQWTQLYQQMIANLIRIPQSSGVEAVPYRLVGEFYDEGQMEPIHRQARDKTSLFLLHSYQLMLAYLFGDYAAAEEAAQQALAYADAARGAAVIPGFVLYDALVQLAGCAPGRGGDGLRQAPKDRRRRLRRVAQHCKQLAYWVSHCAYNHQHRLSLVEAERYRVLGRVEAAIAAYTQAIAQAQHCGQLQDEAVAQELAGRFYWGLGQVKIAQMYLQESRYTYLRWGAIAKVAAMDRAYAELLPSWDAELGLALSRERELGGSLGQSLGRSLDRSLDRSLGRDSLKRYGSDLDLLSITKASQAISGEIHWDKLLAKLMTMILESAGAETADLLLNHHGRWYVEASARLGAEPLVTLVTQMPLDECDRLPHSVLNYCIHSREHLVLADAAGEAYGDLRFSHDPAIATRRPRSLMCLPLIHQGQLIGLLYLANHLTAQVFSAQRVEVLRLLCSQVTISLENARLYAETCDHARTLEQKVAERTQELKEANDELQRLVMLDSLTQVANRRCFDAVLQREWHRMQRQQQPLALILADVDYFKRYNDRYGHPTGDRCLQLVAQALQRAIKRSSDLVARYGGEEFAILLPNTSAKVAILLAKSLRQEMRRLAIPHEGSEVSSLVTMSLGIGYCVPERGQTPQLLIDQADQALYQAKQAGRDRHWLFVASNDDDLSGTG